MTHFFTFRWSFSFSSPLKKNYSLTFPARKVADGGFPLSVVHFSVHSICLTFSFFLLSFIDVVIVVCSSPFVLLFVFLCLFNLSSHSFQSMTSLLLLGIDCNCWPFLFLFLCVHVIVILLLVPLLNLFVTSTSSSSSSAAAVARSNKTCDKNAAMREKKEKTG